MIKTPGQRAGDSFIELLDHVERTAPVSAPPVPVAVRGLGGDTGQVLRGIRAVLMFCAFALACILMLVGAMAYQQGAVGGRMSPLGGSVSLQLSVPGPDPAADYYAHVRFADGTERDLQVGAYLTDQLVSVEFAVQAAAEGATSCRIVIDGVAVASMTAESGRTATCRWSAP